MGRARAAAVGGQRVTRRLDPRLGGQVRCPGSCQGLGQLSDASKNFRTIYSAEASNILDNNNLLNGIVVALLCGMDPLLPESTGFALLLWQVRTRPGRQLTCRLGECNEGFVLVVRDETTGDVPLHEVYANMVALLKRAQSLRGSTMSSTLRSRSAR